MIPKDPDALLTRLFAEQRCADEASAPGFRELMARARAVARSGDAVSGVREGRWAWRAALAAAASFALAVGLFLLHPPPEPPRPSSTSTLASWKAPTDVLLQTPGGDLLGRLPEILPLPPAPGGDDASEPPPASRETTPRSTQTKAPQMKGVES